MKKCMRDLNGKTSYSRKEKHMTTELIRLFEKQWVNVYWKCYRDCKMFFLQSRFLQFLWYTNIECQKLNHSNCVTSRMCHNWCEVPSIYLQKPKRQYGQSWSPATTRENSANEQLFQKQCLCFFFLSMKTFKLCSVIHQESIFVL